MSRTKSNWGRPLDEARGSRELTLCHQTLGFIAALLGYAAILCAGAAARGLDKDETGAVVGTVRFTGEVPAPKLIITSDGSKLEDNDLHPDTGGRQRHTIEIRPGEDAQLAVEWAEGREEGGGKKEEGGVEDGG